MDSNTIKDIREAEKKAEDIIAAANIKAREIVAEAQKNSEKSDENGIAGAQKKSDEAKKAALAEAENEKARIFEEAIKGTDAMDFLTRPKIDKAAEFIIERIVG